MYDWITVPLVYTQVSGFYDWFLIQSSCSVYSHTVTRLAANAAHAHVAEVAYSTMPAKFGSDRPLLPW